MERQESEMGFQRVEDRHFEPPILWTTVGTGHQQ